MKKFWLPLTLIMASILPVPTVSATEMSAPATQSHRGNSGNHRQQGEKKSESNRGGNHRPGNSRPGNNSNNNHRPGNNNGGNHRPGNNGNNNQPGNNTKPGNSGNHGNNGGHGNNNGTHRPGNPGGNHNNGNNHRPGNNHGGNYRPGNPGPPPPSPGRPGGNHRPGHGTSLPRPGNNGHYNHAHWRPLPPPPPRPIHINHYYNVRPSFLGLTLGTMFDVGLNTLINGGFNVVYAANNIMGLTNVNQFGVLWPEASFFYGPAGMTGARFQRITPLWDDWAFNTAYAQLTTLYGQPESVTRTRNSLSAVWWTGGNSYVTLSCAAAPNGIAGYSTDLIFGN